MDDLCARKLVFKLGNPGIIAFLLGIGGLIFGILNEVGIAGDRLLDPLREPDPRLSAMFQFIFERRISGGGHRKCVHVCASIAVREGKASHFTKRGGAGAARVPLPELGTAERPSISARPFRGVGRSRRSTAAAMAL